jgi:hypothetical protein
LLDPLCELLLSAYGEQIAAQRQHHDAAPQLGPALDPDVDPGEPF